jgi:hypothetical protein
MFQNRWQEGLPFRGFAEVFTNAKTENHESKKPIIS